MESNKQGLQLEKALSILKKAIEKREYIVAEGFITMGPKELRKTLSITNNEDWRKLFDYLVIYRGVIKRCVLTYMDFFYDLVSSKGPNAMREVFGIENAKYDVVYEEIFDLVAVSKGAMYTYVRNNCSDFAQLVKQGKAGDLQNRLGLTSKKYQHVWMEILELFVDAVCEDYVDGRAVDQGFYAFSMIFNGIREQRSLRSNAKMWEFSTS